MTRNLFDEGGPHKIKRLGNDQYSMTVSLPKDEDGRLARECPNPECSPGYFKVKPGTGITGEQVTAYCPYCRHATDPKEFSTQEQVRYVKDLVLRQTQEGLQGVIKDALNLGPSGTRKFGGGLVSIEMSFRPGALPYVRRPYEDEVRRDIVCPHCGLDHTVFGLATWCADCGKDIFLSHVAAELDVTRRMVGDIERRKELLGKRVAAKDLENCLEDAVSMFEAAMKATVRRALLRRGEATEQVEARLKQLGNTFQNIRRTRDELAIPPLAYAVSEAASWDLLAATFEKRHPITHNLGVIDRKYIERTQAAEQEGREVRITPAEIEVLLSTVSKAIEDVYRNLVGDGADA